MSGLDLSIAASFAFVFGTSIYVLKIARQFENNLLGKPSRVPFRDRAALGDESLLAEFSEFALRAPLSFLRFLVFYWPARALVCRRRGHDGRHGGECARCGCASNSRGYGLDDRPDMSWFSRRRYTP